MGRKPIYNRGWEAKDYPFTVDVSDSHDYLAIVRWLRECPTYMALVNGSPWNSYLVYRRRIHEAGSLQWCFNDATMAMVFKLRWG